LLQDCRNVTPLPNDRYYGYESRPKRLVHDVVLTNRIQQQCSATGEFLAVTEGSVVLRNVRRALMQIVEVAVRQLFAPAGA